MKSLGHWLVYPLNKTEQDNMRDKNQIGYLNFQVHSECTQRQHMLSGLVRRVVGHTYSYYWRIHVFRICGCINPTVCNYTRPHPQMQYQTERLETQHTLQLVSVLVKLSSMSPMHMNQIWFGKCNCSNWIFNSLTLQVTN